MTGSYLKPEWLAAAALTLPLILTLAWAAPPAAAYERQARPPAIVLAAFGTTEPGALAAILNVEKKVRAAFPQNEVFLAFTANQVREVWRARAGNRAWKAAHPGVPARIYGVANPLAVMARIQDEGARPIFVQSLHITNGTEFEDQLAIVESLAEIKAFQESKRPFPYISLGASALGRGTAKELERAAAALKNLAAEAQAEGAALVLMGHGNDHKNIKSYRNFAAVMSRKYGLPVFMGLVEGRPNFEELMAALKKAQVGKVLLAPFMLVAGDHARNDMAGPEEDSLVSRLRAAGLEVQTRMKGLGANDDWAALYVERLRDQFAAWEKTSAQR